MYKLENFLNILFYDFYILSHIGISQVDMDDKSLYPKIYNMPINRKANKADCLKK